MGGRLTIIANAQGEICTIHKGGGVGVSTSEILRCLRIAAAKAQTITETLKKAVSPEYLFCKISLGLLTLICSNLLVQSTNFIPNSTSFAKGKITIVIQDTPTIRSDWAHLCLNQIPRHHLNGSRHSHDNLWHCLAKWKQFLRLI